MGENGPVLGAGKNHAMNTASVSTLHADDYPPAVNLRPGDDHPEWALVTGLPRVAAILDRIAAGGWPGRTWSSGPSAPGGGCPLPRSRTWSGPGMPGRPGDTSAARSANGPATPVTRSGRANGRPDRSAPGPFRKLDATAVLTGPLLPAPPEGTERM